MKVLRAYLIATIVASVGCGHGAGSYSILADGTTFQQASSSVETKIDVLWVIDNSGSMASSQKNLTDNFTSFINEFGQSGYDFHLGVTTTQAYLANAIWTPFFNTNPSYYDGKAQNEIARLRDGVNNGQHSGFFVLDNKTPDIAGKFLINATQGINGNGDERSFESMQAALDSSLNGGFRRPGAFLAVIILTDEDDFSNPSVKHYETYDKPLTPVQTYVDYLKTLTGSTDAMKRFSVSTIAVPDQTCLNKINNGAQKIGTRVNQLADLTGGIKGNICGDFADELKLISKEIVKLSTQFYLGDAKPVTGTIRVSFNGQSVPEAAGNADGGWAYNADANSIMFSGSWVPPQGAAINVAFDPQEVRF